MPIDVELARLGQLQAKGPKAMTVFATKDLDARAAHLVTKGYAVKQGQGVGFKPDGWARLRDSEIAHALESKMGISGRQFSHGQSEGVVIGHLKTSLGTHDVIDRGVGIAIAPTSNGQELSIGHVISAGLDR
jgi:hypothetical protein